MIGNSVEFTYDPFFNLLRQASTPEGLTLNHSLDGRGTVTSEVAPYVNTILAHHLRWSPIH